MRVFLRPQITNRKVDNLNPRNTGNYPLPEKSLLTHWPNQCGTGAGGINTTTFIDNGKTILPAIGNDRFLQESKFLLRSIELMQLP